MHQKDYYKMLGVSKSASEDEIKKAYRKLAHQYHPDKAGGDEKKFKEINEAYQVLGNKEKRAQYDQFGKVFEGGDMPGGGANPFEGFDFGGGGFSWNAGMGGDMNDIFESIFEQFGGGGRRQSASSHGSDVEIIQHLTLEEAFRGVTRDLEFKTNVACAVCGGIGYQKEQGQKDCAKCGGRGELRVERRTFFGRFSQVQQCPDCFGVGKTPNAPCASCKGTGRVFGTRTVRVTIAPGIDDGQVIKVHGGGETGERGGGNGDLYIVVKIKPHAHFTRVKSDLYLVKKITLAEMLLERPVKLKDIGGEEFSITIPAGFSLKEKMRVPHRGMPKFGSAARGDLYLLFDLEVPKHLSAKAKKLLGELNDELGS